MACEGPREFCNGSLQSFVSQVFRVSFCVACTPSPFLYACAARVLTCLPAHARILTPTQTLMFTPTHILIFMLTQVLISIRKPWSPCIISSSDLRKRLFQVKGWARSEDFVAALTG